MPNQPDIGRILREMAIISAAIAAGIIADIAEMDRRAKELEDQLFVALQKDMLVKLKVDEGLVENTAPNLGKVVLVDGILEKWGGKLRALVDYFSARLLALIDSIGDYFAIGFDPVKVEKISALNAAIYARIGIVGTELISGGYLDSLAKTDALKTLLKQYMLKGISGQVALADLTEGLRLLVVGNSDAVGYLQGYFRQYAYDVFNQVRELKSLEFSEGLGLVNLIYQGSLIDTSRKFCEKRAGKVYSITDTDTWKDDPDLVEKKTKETYLPLIERGRYNCRHWIDYISQEMADYLNANQFP